MTFHQIVQNQRRFFTTGKTLPIQYRIDQLNQLKQLLSENADQLSHAIYLDIRRSKPQSYCYEVSNVITEIDYMIENVAEWAAPKKVEKTMMQLLDTPMVAKDPLGVVLIISPWNYPVNLSFLPLAPAIAAGNTVIIKPSEMATHCADLIAELIEKYFDPNYITVVKGGVPETTSLLTERFDHIMYTGATEIGKIVMEAAAKHLTPVTLELGGKCPVIVESDADIAIAGRRIAWGKWLNCGQTCLAPDYILTTEEVKPKLVESVRQSLSDFYQNDTKNHADYSRIINQKQFDRLRSLLEQSKGVQLLGDSDQLDRSDLYFPPTVLDVKTDDIFMKDEIFGPILPIVTVSDLDEALTTIKSGEKPLAAYIFTNDESKVQRLVRETSSGGVTVNDVILHLTVDTLPFGGVGNSGMGRYRGKYGFDTFSHEKAILKRGYFGESLFAMMRYPPFTPAKFENLKAFTSGRKAIPKFIAKLCKYLPIFIVGIILGIIIQRFILFH